MHREELQGRAAGVMVGAIVGLAWVASTLSRLSTTVAIPVPAAGVTTVLTLTAGALRLRRAATTMSLGATGAPTTLWQLLPGFGAAVVLWPRTHASWPRPHDPSHGDNTGPHQATDASRRQVGAGSLRDRLGLGRPQHLLGIRRRVASRHHRGSLERQGRAGNATVTLFAVSLTPPLAIVRKVR